VILVDTSVWINHLREGSPTLAELLENEAVLAHPWVTGELALGNLTGRAEILRLLQDLPQAGVADDRELLQLIGQQRLYGVGIGYVDAQLLAASKLRPGTALWTADKRLSTLATRFGVGFKPVPPGR
jgi:predicted nucleic acid-binding protein